MAHLVMPTPPLPLLLRPSHRLRHPSLHFPRPMYRPPLLAPPLLKTVTRGLTGRRQGREVEGGNGRRPQQRERPRACYAVIVAVAVVVRAHPLDALRLVSSVAVALQPLSPLPLRLLRLLLRGAAAAAAVAPWGSHSAVTAPLPSRCRTAQTRPRARRASRESCS